MALLKLFSAGDKAKNRAKSKAMKRVTAKIESMEYLRKLERDIDIAIAEPVEVLNVWDAKNSKWLK